MASEGIRLMNGVAERLGPTATGACLAPGSKGKTALRTLAALGVAILVGCGDGRLPTAPVSGVVTLDGKPVTSGAVVFTPDHGWPAQGELDSDGRFVLSTYEEGDGAILGEHRIVVIAQTGDDPEEHFERPPSKPIKSLVPDRYANKATSGLSYEVKPGESNEVQLPLLSKGR